ncbi:hypothetical protein HOY81_22495 [Streptomyces sp. JJ36]|nr:hypothetical protein [Streptomyces sp. JJ36]
MSDSSGAPGAPEAHRPSAPPAPYERRVPRAPLPAGRPRAWYIAHNRQLKAMRLAIALLDSGVHTPGRATDRRIGALAERIGVHPPSRTTCRLVRSLLPASPARSR